MKKSTLLWFIYSVFLFISCTTEKNKENKQEKFQVISPFIKDTTYQYEYVADINALQNVEIRTRIKGFIEDIHVDEGQFVHKGQIILSISSKEYQQNLLKAKATTKIALADLRSAEIELINIQKLLDKDIVAKTELDMIKAKIEAMNAKVAEAQSDETQAALNLSFAEIRAPFDGTINRLPNKEGSLITEGTLLTTISNTKEVYAYFNVSEKDYLDYIVSKEHNKSKEVSLMLANNTLYDQLGIIETTESEFDKSTGTIAFRAKFPNPKQLLKHGSSGKILVKIELKNAMLIPQKSTFEVQENVYVFVMNQQNTVQLRKVNIAFRLPQLYVITSGLSIDDKFIYEGIQNLKEGDKITPEFIQLSRLINVQTN